MFENLTSRLGSTLDRLRSRGRLTEDNIKEALREVRTALLEADVALPVVRVFIARVRERAVGQDVLASLTPGQALVRVVRDELTELMGGSSSGLALNVQPPAVVLVAGLQGSGKTTTVAKLARWLKEQSGKSVMTVSCDVYRPAAIDQLRTLADQVGAGFIPSAPGDDPVAIATGALTEARRRFADVLLVDTAGRLHVDDRMMDEIRRIHSAVAPVETLFVVDGMTGQDAAETSRAFDAVLPLTGIVLTKTDGDARGGAALSVRHVTGKPIKFLGVGEKTDALEAFHPDRIASRILGMGDMLSLIEEVEQKVDRDKAEKLARKLVKGKQFDLEDFSEQLPDANMGGVTGMEPGQGREARQEAGEGQAVRPGGFFRAACPDAEHGRRDRHARQAARNARSAGRRARPGQRPRVRRHGGDHLVDDHAGAPLSRRHQGFAQAPYRLGLGNSGAGREPAAQAVHPDAEDDETHAQEGWNGTHAARDARGHATGARRRNASRARLIRPVRQFAGNSQALRRWPINPYTSLLVSGFIFFALAGEATGSISSDGDNSTRPSGREAQALLPCGGGRQPQPARWTVHRASRFLQSDRDRKRGAGPNRYRPRRPLEVLRCSGQRCGREAAPLAIAARSDHAGASGRRQRMAASEHRRVVLGSIGGPYGTRGWVKIQSGTEPPENILRYSPWQVGRDDRWSRIGVAEGRSQGRGVVARLDGCHDRGDASVYRGCEIAVERSQLPKAEEGEFYWADLVGLRVVTTGGVDLGEVGRMMETGANDVMVVRGDVERLIPFLDGTVVQSVEIAGGTIVVDWHPDD